MQVKPRVPGVRPRDRPRVHTMRPRAMSRETPRHSVAELCYVLKLCDVTSRALLLSDHPVNWGCFACFMSSILLTTSSTSPSAICLAGHHALLMAESNTWHENIAYCTNDLRLTEAADTICMSTHTFWLSQLHRQAWAAIMCNKLLCTAAIPTLHETVIP